MNFCVYLQLEYLSIAGFLFVLMLLFTMVVESCKAGLPAIGNGEFSVVGFTDICEPPPVPPPVIFSISSLNTITQYHYSIPFLNTIIQRRIRLCCAWYWEIEKGKQADFFCRLGVPCTA